MVASKRVELLRIIHQNLNLARLPIPPRSHIGAGDRGRTGTVLLPLDFKSKASAYSATPAYLFAFLARRLTSITQTRWIFVVNHQSLCCVILLYHIFFHLSIGFAIVYNLFTNFFCFYFVHETSSCFIVYVLYHNHSVLSIHFCNRLHFIYKLV